MTRYQSKQLRQARISTVGAYYHLRLCCQNRTPYFESPLHAECAIKSAHWIDEKNLTQTQCIVLMPDHIHWLVTLKSDNLSNIVTQYKRSINWKLAYERASTGVKWQDGFYHSQIRTEWQLNNVRQYILGNPARAGIAKDFRDYPHCWAPMLDES
ncbi:MAG: transposase [Gammaproteobacteria bacterium]|nr:transposase [Gammaproteobacteria bacterium]